MSDVREVFPVLADAVSGEGEALISRVAGEASAGIAGSIGFAFKDSSGNVVLPMLDSSGKLPVSTQSPGECMYERALLASGSQTVGTAAVAVTMVLTAGMTYEQIELTASCFRNGLVQVVWNDDGAETVLLDGVIAAGQFTLHLMHHCVEFDAGATGDQELLVKFTPTDKVSDFRATISALQKAV